MLRETVQQVDEGLARLLEMVRAGEMTAARLKELVAASRSWEAKVTALQTDAARLIAQQESHGDGGASVLRDQAGKTKHQARKTLGTAEVLDEMPGLRAAVDSGEVALANAERLADAAQRTAPEAVDGAADLLTMAKELPPDEFAREASAWTQHHQPDHGHGDWLEKRRQRYLKTWRQKDGSVRLNGLLDPETGTRICNRLQNAAEHLHRQDQKTARANREDSGLGPGPADGGQASSEGLAFGEGPVDSEGSAATSGPNGGEGPRSWDQLRADALDLLTSGDTEGLTGGGSGGRLKAEIIAVADIGVLTGDNPAGRCEISGVGPVPPEVLQRIACDAQLTGLIFSDGKPLHHGSTVRTATGAQWRMLIARDRGCIGCGAPPEQCQAHHIVPYARARRTDIDNLVLVCWRCHHNIHDHHWRVVHHNGKPALQPPNPQAPPNPADGRHPHDTRDTRPSPASSRSHSHETTRDTRDTSGTRPQRPPGSGGSDPASEPARDARSTRPQRPPGGSGRSDPASGPARDTRSTRPQRPPGGSGRSDPASGPARDTRSTRPQRPPRSPRSAKTRTGPAPNRAGPDPPTGGPDPPPQTPALFTAEST